MDYEKEITKSNERKDNRENMDDNNEEQDENSINVYDDNAYMLEEDGSDNNSKNENYLNDLEEHEQVQDQELDLKQEKQNEIEGLDDFQNNEDNHEQNNYFKFVEPKMNINQNQNETNDIKNNSQNKNNNNIINDINKDNDIKNSENEINIQNIENMNNLDENINENGELGEEVEEEGEGDEEDNLPLVTLKYVSICQFCKNAFDSKKHLPYLFKCGHFFCKECIEEQFTDDEGIKCPIDGLIAKSINEFKLLNNLITDKNIPTQRDENNNNINSNNVCHVHNGQKLTHIVVNTKEIVCVYCAFDLVRKNPNCEVKEIKELLEEYVTYADKIININQNNVEIIQKSLKVIKDNKQREEKNVNNYFEHILKYINTKKEDILSKIDSIFTDNATLLSQKLETFSEQIEMGESLKKLINNYKNNKNNEYNYIYEAFLKMENINDKEKNNKINLKEYKFIHDDESKIMRYINFFGDIKCSYKYIPFKNGCQKKNNNDNNENFKPNCYSYISTDITNNNNNSNYQNYRTNISNKKENSIFLDEDNSNYINNTNICLNSQNNINIPEYDLRINKYNKKPFNYTESHNFNKGESFNNDKININWIKYKLNREKIYNNNNFNNNIFKYKRTEYNSIKRIKSPIFSRNNISGNNADSFHRLSSPMTYTYTFQRNNK